MFWTTKLQVIVSPSTANAPGHSLDADAPVPGSCACAAPGRATASTMRSASIGRARRQRVAFLAEAIMELPPVKVRAHTGARKTLTRRETNSTPWLPRPHLSFVVPTCPQAVERYEAPTSMTTVI